MRRAFVLLLLAVCVAPAAHAGEGVYITIDAGYSFWNKDKLRTGLTSQVGAANTSLLLDKQMPDGVLTGLRLGYNIGGHVAFEGNLTVHPWDVLSKDRGAVGMAGLAARWFPLQGLVRPSRQADFSLSAGMDYVLMGGNGDPDVPNTGRGFDGMAVELGGTFELYPARWVSLGLTPRVYLMHPVRYFTDYNNRDVGGQIPLVGNVGGTLYSLSLSVTFHFEPLPD